MPSTRALVEGKVAKEMKEVDEEGSDPGDKDKDMDVLLGNKDKVQPPAVSQRGIVIAAIFYSACAATLLVFNKLAVRAVPSSSFNVAIQLLAAAVISRGLGIAGFVDCPGLQTKKVKKFLPVTILFTLCLYTNVKALSGTSVNTLIVTRASTPIFVAVPMPASDARARPTTVATHRFPRPRDAGYGRRIPADRLAVSYDVVVTRRNICRSVLVRIDRRRIQSWVVLLARDLSGVLMYRNGVREAHRRQRRDDHLGASLLQQPARPALLRPLRRRHE